ncbi:MAG: hypothetical protein AAB904_01935 [Patescibacteria group bacterium]|mgnify:CR=1 FL=1
MRRKLERLLAEAREKGRTVSYFPSDGSRPTAELLSQDLFAHKRCLWSENMFQDSAREAELLEALPRLAASPDIFIFTEEELSESLQDTLKRAGVKVEEIKNPSSKYLLSWAEGEAKKLGLPLSESRLKEIAEEAAGDPWALEAVLLRAASGGEAEKKHLPTAKEPSFAPSFVKTMEGKKASEGKPNYFDFADAASAKNRGRAIKLLSGYIKEGLGAEEAFWKLWWKIKTLRMVEAHAKDTGVHWFAERKAREDLRRWNTGELEEYSRALCDLFSEARRGERDFEEGLLALLVR